MLCAQPGLPPSSAHTALTHLSQEMCVVHLKYFSWKEAAVCELLSVIIKSLTKKEIQRFLSKIIASGQKCQLFLRPYSGLCHSTYFIMLESTFAETGDGSPTHVSFGCFRRTRGRRICRNVRMVLTRIHTQLSAGGNTTQEL